MNRFLEIFNSLVVQSLGQIRGFVAQYGAAFLFALAIIALGWLFAVLIRKIVAKILRAFGFDVVAQKIGFKKFLEKGGIEKNPSSIIGWIFYWMIFINALIMAQDTLDLKVTSQFMQNMILFIPNIIVVVLLLGLAIYIGKFISRFTEKTARLAAIPFPGLAGSVAQYVVIGAAIMMALDYVNAATAVVIDSFVILFIVVPAAALLVMLLGGKDVFRNMLDGRFLSETIKEGDIIEIESFSGKIISIGVVSTKLEAENEEIIIPNSELARKIIKRKI